MPDLLLAAKGLEITPRTRRYKRQQRPAALCQRLGGLD